MTILETEVSSCRAEMEMMEKKDPQALLDHLLVSFHVVMKYLGIFSTVF